MRAYQFVTPRNVGALNIRDFGSLCNHLGRHGVRESDVFQVVTSPKATWTWRFINDEKGNRILRGEELEWELLDLPPMESLA